MTRPPRPAPVVAAAVLLLIVGPEVLLVGLAGIAAAIWWAIESAEPPNFWILGVSAVPLGLGIEMLVIGVKLLRGTLQRPSKAADRVAGFGGLFAVPTLFTMFCCGVVIATEHDPIGRAMTLEVSRLIAGVVLLWATAATTLIAGVLLRKNAQRYLDWQEAIRRPREDAEYDLDEPGA